MTKPSPSTKRRKPEPRIVRDEAYVCRMQTSDSRAADEASDLLAQAAVTVKRKRRKMRAKRLTKDERRRKRASEQRLAPLNRAMKAYAKTKRTVKARKLWQCVGGITIEPYLATSKEGKRAKPIYTLPRTKEAYEQMVEQMAWGIAADDLQRPRGEKPWTDCYGSNESYYSAARAALSSIGINPIKS